MLSLFNLKTFEKLEMNPSYIGGPFIIKHHTKNTTLCYYDSVSHKLKDLKFPLELLSYKLLEDNKHAVVLLKFAIVVIDCMKLKYKLFKILNDSVFSTFILQNDLILLT